MHGSRIFLPKLTLSEQYKILSEIYSHSFIRSCVSIERLKYPKNMYTPSTVYTQACHFYPFELYTAAHVIMRDNGQIYDIPSNFLIPYNLGNYPSRRVEKYTLLNLPSDLHVGDKIYIHAKHE